MDNHNIAIIVQGLFEKSDSIGYDAKFEFKLLKELYGESKVRIFSERFDAKLHKDISIEPMADYWTHLDNTPNLTTIYHYCDGWPEVDDFILTSDRLFVVRWHNNTPPWFFAPYACKYHLYHREELHRCLKHMNITHIHFQGTVR